MPQPRPASQRLASSAALCAMSDPPTHAVITDPLFYLLAIPAVTLLGLAKGGFAGLGMIATPLLALVVPPLRRRRHFAADPDLPGRDFGVDLSPLLERVEFEGAGAGLGVRRRRRLAARKLLSNAAIELTVGIDRAVLRALRLARHTAALLPRPAAGESRAAAASGHGLRSGARCPASPRRWCRSARRRFRSTCCRSASTS